MFHLIKKYSNRKMYDTCLKKFIRLEELIGFILGHDEIRIVDSDTNIDLTGLEVSKAIVRYMNDGNPVPESLTILLREISERKAGAQPLMKEKHKPSLGDADDEVLSYVPAEIRLLNKSIEYLHGAIHILKDENPYNAKLHDELYVTFKEFDRKLAELKKKYRIS
ncbi:MAG: hypothetical protein A2Y33_04885 [Spirochaetes bacterium GWF1_51_8]|nr:MAG: hypothetical protein A2Y33_04885 [Spirochaetes bacterium GWF1_51_8]